MSFRKRVENLLVVVGLGLAFAAIAQPENGSPRTTAGAQANALGVAGLAIDDVVDVWQLRTAGLDCSAMAASTMVCTGPAKAFGQSAELLVVIESNWVRGLQATIPSKHDESVFREVERFLGKPAKVERRKLVNDSKPDVSVVMAWSFPDDPDLRATLESNAYGAGETTVNLGRLSGGWEADVQRRARIGEERAKLVLRASNAVGASTSVTLRVVLQTAIGQP